MRNVNPCLEMQALGFGPLLLIKSFPVSMSGSGRSFTAYIFSKVRRGGLNALCVKVQRWALRISDSGRSCNAYFFVQRV